MKAGEVCINDIFNGARLIEVPFYQRAYVWKEEQWERFLTDMEYVSDTQSVTIYQRILSVRLFI